jgi:hypothetical protein
MARTSATSSRRASAPSVLVAVILGFGFSVLGQTSAIAAECSQGEVRDGTCPAVVDGTVNEGSVDLDGTAGLPGQPGETSADSPSTGGAPPPNIQDPDCLRPQPNRPAECYEVGEPGEPGIPTITIRDIATFVPTPARQQMEPDGWTVAGLDTNFYAITGSHVVSGTLLGRPAEVRFTPTAYRWAYGDGTSATKYTKGGTWAALRIPEFERTPTSHVYEQLGDYTITLDVVFVAEYRFDGGTWRPVIGSLTLPANDLQIRVGTAKTVLVEHDCLANPAGPGC